MVIVSIIGQMSFFITIIIIIIIIIIIEETHLLCQSPHSTNTL